MRFAVVAATLCSCSFVAVRETPRADEPGARLECSTYGMPVLDLLGIIPSGVGFIVGGVRADLAKERGQSDSEERAAMLALGGLAFIQLAGAIYGFATESFCRSKLTDPRVVP